MAKRGIDARLILFAPDLPVEAQDVPTDGLEKLLSRAESAPAGADPVAALCALFGLGRESEAADIPYAAICRLGEGFDDACEGGWLRADPVQLVADRDRVFFGATAPPDLHADEARAICAEINDLLADDGVKIEAVAADRWYLRLPRAPGLSTSPPWRVIGRDIHDFLPDGADGSWWRARLTEIQMLLHASEVNAAREARRQAPVNSVWLWGGGALPEEVDRPGERMVGGGPLGRGLARLADMEAVDAAAGFDALAGGSGPAVAALGRPFDEPRPSLGEVEHAWASPALDALRRGELAGVELWTNGRRFEAKRRHARRWWRRRRPLTSLLEPPG